MTARVVPLHGADILLYPPESLNPELWQRWRETRALNAEADEKLRCYERVLRVDDDGDTAA